MTCGDLGGVTVRGDPCKRKAGWGIPGTNDGPCKDHVGTVTPAEPEVQSITAPEGYAYAVRIDAGTMAKARALTLTPVVLQGEQPEPPPVVEPPVEPEPPPVINPPGPLPESAAFIIGPQVPLGESPWPWFDEAQVAHGVRHHADYMSRTEGLTERQYYDLALSLYVLHARSGEAAHQQMARDVAAKWWAGMPDLVAWDNSPFAIAPRNASLGGLMLYAMQGGGVDALTFKNWPIGTTVSYDLWGWLAAFAREHYNIWLGRALANPSLWGGVRDGAFTLLACAQLAHVHPSAAVRGEMRAMTLAAARDYYARLQRDDGGWYWHDGGEEWSQPFMVGLLLEALIATHQLTGDAAVAQAIVRGADWLWSTYDAGSTVAERPDVRWRRFPYFAFPDGRPQTHGGLAGGWDTNSIREGRQLNSTIIHAFGYAHQLTGDAKHRTRGDEVFAATHGKGQGPGADDFYNLIDYGAKEYNQSCRSGGRYLAWRK